MLRIQQPAGAYVGSVLETVQSKKEFQRSFQQNNKSIGLCVGVYLGFRHSSVCYVMIWNVRMRIYAHTLKWRILASNVRNIRTYGVYVCTYLYARHNLTRLHAPASRRRAPSKGNETVRERVSF